MRVLLDDRLFRLVQALMAGVDVLVIVAEFGTAHHGTLVQLIMRLQLRRRELWRGEDPRVQDRGWACHCLWRLGNQFILRP